MSQREETDMMTPPASNSFVTIQKVEQETAQTEVAEEPQEKAKKNTTEEEILFVPEKKPFHKTYIPFLGLGICVVIVGLLAFFFMGAKTKVDVQQYMTVSLSGINGKGHANYSLDYDAMYTELIQEDDKKSFEKTRFLEKLYCTVTPSDGLSNGDEITVTVEYDENLAKEAGISITKDSYTIEVNDLAIPEDIDLFEGVDISFMGTEPYGSLVTNTGSSSDFVRNSVTFYTEQDGMLSNGDEITVYASYSDYDAESALLNPTVTEKTYTVAGLDAYLRSFETVDLTALKQEISDSIDAMVAKKSGGSSYFADISLGREGSVQKITEKETYLVFLKENRDESTFNYLYTFYEADCLDWTGDPVKVYFAIEVEDVIIDSKGILHWDTDISYESTKDSSKLVPQLVTAKKADYNIVQWQPPTEEQEGE